MSSFATATSRTAEKESPNGTPPHMLGNPDTAPVMDAPRAEAPAHNSQTIDEVTRVERLLAQMEARSMALVPYGYGRLKEVSTRKSSTALLAGVLVAIWLSSLILAVAYMRYVGHSPFASDRTVATAPPLVIAPENDPQEQKVAASVDHLAKALVSSSERMNQLQAAVEKSNRDWQKIATKVNTEHITTVPVKVSNQVLPSQVPTVAMAEANLPKNWHRVIEVKPTDTAMPHKTPDGVIDYWLVQRAGDASPSKVLPIGTSSDGVVVHNLEDGKDYTLTPSGEWKNGSLMTPAGN